MSPIIDNDEDDVSSMGEGDMEHDETRHHLDRPHQRMRCKSITRILKASMRGRSVSVTDEEKDIIAQLAEATGASARSGGSTDAAAAAVGSRERSQGSTTSKDVGTQTLQPDAGAGPTAETVAPGTKSPPPSSTERARGTSRPKAPPQGARTSDRVPADKVRRDESSSDEESETQDPHQVAAQRTETTHVGQASEGDAKKLVKQSTKTQMQDSPDAGPVEGGDADSESDESVKVVGLSAKLMFSHRPPPSWSKKRARYSSEEDDDSSDEEAPRKSFKYSRRCKNKWASPKRKRKVIRGEAGGDASPKENTKPASNKKKKSAKKTRSTFSDDEDVPVMPSSKSDRERRPKKRKKRVLFTADEDHAIREGSKQFGKGCWKEIKLHDPRLVNRTPGQIKDRYRILEQHGDLE